MAQPLFRIVTIEGFAFTTIPRLRLSFIITYNAPISKLVLKNLNRAHGYSNKDG
ncbi:MAG: hypothetical protein ACKOE5_06335 [Cytophagales bacterium]